MATSSGTDAERDCKVSIHDIKCWLSCDKYEKGLIRHKQEGAIESKSRLQKVRYETKAEV